MSQIQEDGVVVSEGPVRIDVYEDFLCPYCRRFEEDAGETLDALAADGRAQVVFHPVAFLDRLSTTEYSTRAAEAAACAADAGRFRELARALFANQPEEGGPGLSDDELERLAGEAGVATDCLAEHRHRSWVVSVGAAAMTAGVEGIPTVLVDGRQVDAGAEAIRAAVG
jgi:protein-disulfide isomerase